MRKTDLAPLQRAIDKLNRLVFKNLSPEDERSPIFKKLREPGVVLKDDEIRERIKLQFEYDLDRTVRDIRRDYSFDISCQGTVPEAIISFLESESYEDAVRNAVSLGGDSDTLACITGGIAEAFYGDVPEDVRTKVEECLTPELWEITQEFCDKYLL